MNLPLFFARRYLFARRSTNAIHIITGIAVGGIAIGAAALILVLSVFNGLEVMISGMFGSFDPDLKITPAKGKTFELDSAQLARIRALDGVNVASVTLEEIAFFEHEGAQDFGVLKGVDEFYRHLNGMDTLVRDGSFRLRNGDRDCIVMSRNIARKLGVQVENPLQPVSIYMPDGKSGVMEQPFKMRFALPAGEFDAIQDEEHEFVLTNLDLVRELLEASPNTMSALDVKCRPGANIESVRADIAAIIGADLIIKNRNEQNETFLKVMRLEKWMGFAIAGLMLLLMAFNLVGALWMIVLDKQADISILKSMGADNRTVYRIFLFEGLMLTGVGLIVGLSLGALVYGAQKSFAFITIPQGSGFQPYPVDMRWSDFIPVILTVFAIGLLAALAPAKRAADVPAFLREE